LIDYKLAVPGLQIDIAVRARGGLEVIRGRKNMGKTDSMDVGTVGNDVAFRLGETVFDRLDGDITSIMFHRIGK
jgi:hypothetical protein